MATDVAHPVALAPNARSNRDLGVELHAELKVTFKGRLGDGSCLRDRGAALEATVQHGVEVPLLWFLGRGGLGRRTVDRFMEDRVAGVVLLHSAEVGGTF